MFSFRLFGLVLLAMLAFAANSLLCRAALRQTTIDAATFTLVRLASGALVLTILARRGSSGGGGNWWSAAALFVYAAAFSLAYRTLTAGTGALLLFGAVQLTMILAGWRAGERLRAGQLTGVVLASPPAGGAALMLASGVAWGVYSLRGRGVSDPLGATAGNFLRAAPLGLIFCLLMLRGLNGDATGALYAVASGALASGLGYAVWYTALRGLTATRAATVQLSVPLIAALGGILLLGEPLAWRLALAGGTILGGIALVVYEKR